MPGKPSRALQRRAGELRDDLRFLMRAADPDFVYYVEARGRGDRSFAPRPSTSRASSVTRCSIACGRRSDLGDARRGRIVRLREGTARHPRTPTKSASPPSSTTRARPLLYLPRRMPPPKAPNFAEAAAREIDRDGQAVARASLRALHQLRRAARRPAFRRDGAALSGPGAGHRTSFDPPRTVPHHAERGTARNFELLAGRGRRR